MNLKELLLLSIIIILGFAFRFHGINFDKTCCQHPDERAIVMFTLPLTPPANLNQFLNPQSPWNPHFFAYGNLPLYLLKSTATAASFFNPHLLEYSYINLVGRFISIVADVLTIALIFLIGKTVKDKRAGFAAAFIYSLSALPIQYSHFYTSDILLTTFIGLCIWRVIRFYQKPTLPNAALAGIAFGLALSTKISAIPLISSISAALLLDFIFEIKKSPHRPKLWLPHIPHVFKKILTEGVVIIIFTLTTFLISQPYAAIDSTEFIKQNAAQANMTRDAYTFPYTLQYVGKIPYIYEIKNLFLWGVGPVIFILFIIGLFSIFTGIRKMPHKKQAEICIILAFCGLYFLTVGKFAIGFMRYLLPLYPFLALFAGVGFMRIIKIVEKQNKKISAGVLTIVTVAIFVWPLSFSSIYSKTNTRLAATEWINKNIPDGSSLTHEVWDDALPMYTDKKFNMVDLSLYDQPDNEIKWNILRSKMNSADYLIISSNRLYVPIQKLDDCLKYKVCFPIGSKFYKDLLGGKLKFKKVAEFTSYPTIPLLNIPINDDHADESFTVYDHPKVMIFKRL